MQRYGLEREFCNRSKSVICGLSKCLFLGIAYFLIILSVHTDGEMGVWILESRDIVKYEQKERECVVSHFRSLFMLSF